MKYLLTILLSCVLINSYGTKYTIAQTSGTLTITQTMETHTLVAGDTISLSPSAVFNMYQVQNINASSGAHIVVLGNGAKCTNASFQQPYFFNCSYIDIYNLDCINFYGQTRMSYGAHDILFSGCDAIWDGTSNRNNGAEWIIFDDPFAASSMVFDGTKAKTFYNFRFTGARYQGYQNGNFMRFGTTWSGSDDNRSICTDIEIDHDTVSDFRNTSGGINGQGLIAFFGTVFNYNIHHNIVERLAGMASFQRSHIVAFEFYGNGKIWNNRQDSSYAQLARLYPTKWTGLAGYGAGVYLWNNIVHNQYSYSAFEVGQNNLGDRNGTYLMSGTNDTCVHNTVYRTLANTYFAGGGVYRYYGRVIDDVNQTPNINYVARNVIITPEYDYTYAGGTDYSIAVVSSANSNLSSVGNQQAATWTTSIWDDTTYFVPASGSALINAGATFSFRTSDYYGNPLNGTPDVGAVERQAAVGSRYQTLRLKRRGT